MKWMDFLKKVMGKNEIKDSKEIVDVDEIINLFEIKEKEIKEKEKEIFVSIKDKISVIIEDLNEKVKILEKIDMKSIKAEDRVKLIVKGNVDNYARYVKNLIEKLDNLKEENFEKFIDVLKEIFLDFDKKSYTSYQKATFLVGKEMVVIKEIIINFSKYIEKLFKENKDIIDSFKIIHSIKLKLEEIDEIKDSIKKVSKKNKSFDEDIRNTKENNNKFLEEIENIKKNDGHIENLKKQEEIKLNKEELEKEIFRLREMIDFKALGNIFHVDEKKMNIIKAHKEEFQKVFQKDDGAEVLSLLDEAKLNNETISMKIKQINDKNEKIIKNESTIKKDETEDLLVEIKKIKLKIENLNDERIKEIKKYDKLKINEEKIRDSLRQDWVKIR